MIKIFSESLEVLYPAEEIVVLSSDDLKELKRLASINIRSRVRLCAHRSPNDSLHEMFIVHYKNCYVRPHKHLKKDESILVLEGEVDLVIFNEDGSIRQINELGALVSGKYFYQRLPAETFHMLIVRSNLLVFHESTEGPFLRENTVFPDWAPAVEGIASKEFVSTIEALIKEKNLWK